jgi:HSP20 family protein
MAGDFIRFQRSLFFMPAAQPASEPAWRPPTDIYRTPTGWRIKFDLAGVRPEDVRLTVNGNRLTVCGARRDCTLEEGCSHYQMEISYSHFERCITLPTNLDRARLTLEHRDGMLLVHVEMEAAK